MDIKDVVIVGMGRTARGKFGGTLKDMEVDDIAAALLRGLFKKIDFDAGQVDFLFWGQTRQAGYGGNPGRAVAYKAGIPIETPASTINMTCISAMQAVIQGIRMIMLEEAETVVAGGMENMSGCHYILKKARWGLRSGHQQLMDDLYVPCRLCGLNMVATGDNVAKKYGITKDEQDEFAFRSHQKAVNAQEKGWFEEEIIPIEVPQRKGPPVRFSMDECIRKETSLEKIKSLKPVYEGGTVTAGNACPLTDGANGIIITSREKAKKMGFKPLAHFLSYATVGVDPAYMGIGPIYSTPLALKKAGLAMKDIDLIEFNEAFASQVIAGIRELKIDPDRLNIHGGAIALGHPTGSTGSRLIVTLYHALKRTAGRIGLATLCGGGGLGGTVIIEVED